MLSKRCATCILTAGDRMHVDPERLRVIIGHALAAGTFVVCHDPSIVLRAYRRPVEVPLPGTDRRCSLPASY